MPQPPLAILYRFTLRPDHHDAFLQAWTTLTDHIQQHAHSHGSCLHRTGPDQFTAYARWPSRAAFEGADLDSETLAPLRAAMRATCESVEILQEMEVVADHLRLP